MRILVCGGTGYFGSRLIRDLSLQNVYDELSVRVLDNSIQPYALINLPQRARFEFIEGDMRDKEALRRALKDVDVMFDLAGITRVAFTFQNKELTFDVNVGGVRNAVGQLLDSGISKVVYSSTASVYGVTQGAVTEEAACKPTTPYADSKHQAEEIYLEALEKNGVDVTIARFGSLYGYSGGTMRFDTLINRFSLLSALKLPLTVNAGTETERRPFLHVSDATGALMFLQSRRESKGQIYNVAGENASTEEVVDIIKHMIPSTRVTYVKRPYDAPLSYEYNTSKIYNLGFQTHHNLREGITELVDLFSGFFQVN